MNTRPQLAIIVTGIRRCTVYYYPNWTPVFESEHKDTERLAANFMLGINNSNSDYVVRVDADDWNNIPSSFYERGIRALEDNPNVHAVSPLYIVMKDGKVLLEIRQPQGAGIFYRRGQLELLGYDITLDYQADLEFYIRFLTHYKMEQRDELVYLWGFKESRSLKNPEKALSARAIILKTYGYDDNAVHHFGLYPYKEQLA